MSQPTFQPNQGAVFLPVYGGSSTKIFSAWNKNSWFKYPYFFTSAAYACKQFPNIRKDLDIDDDITIFSDSGGYTVLSQGARIDPEEIIDWYNRNAQFGTMLDYPPYLDVHKGVTSEEIFNEKLKMSLKSTSIMLDRKKESVKLYGVLHGGSDQQLDKWRSEIESLGDWYGYALSPAPINDPTSVLKFIRYILKRKIEKPLHFLVTGEKVCFLLLSRFSRFYDHRITVDSSSHLKKAANMWFIVPSFGKDLNVSQRTENGFTVRKPYCECPVCTKVTLEELRNPRVLQFHNLWAMLGQYNFLNSIADGTYGALQEIIGISVEYVKHLDKVLAGSEANGLGTFFGGD